MEYKIKNLEKFKSLQSLKNKQTLRIKKSPSSLFKFALIVTIFFSVNKMLLALPMEVDDIRANGFLGKMQGDVAEQLTKATEMINKYTEMLKKAQTQIDNLNEINHIMSDMNSFINGSSIAIADPRELINNLQDVTKRMEKNFNRLKNDIKNYNYADHIHSKRLKGLCPELEIDKVKAGITKLSFVNTGKETELTKASRAFFDAISDDINGNIDSLISGLKGRALAIVTCRQFAENHYAMRKKEYEKEKTLALLNNDFDTYYKIAKEELLDDKKHKKELGDAITEETQPLFKRSIQMLETLGVQDKSYKGKDGKPLYCTLKKDDNGEEFCYPNAFDVARLNNDYEKYQADLRKQLAEAGNDKEKQARAYANMKMQGNDLVLSYIKDIANNLSFLNETMALTSNLIAKDYKNKYDTAPDVSVLTEKQQDELDDLNDKIDQSGSGKTLKDYAKNVKFNRFGFPIDILYSKSNKGNSNSEGGLE
ncbi:hypothetical protein BKH41_01855 [Helicobacter sp. 12S02232-10]|uniref:hypothetical protein n=1 Tax=Helicobacter sp. 12S02232-10 TaxID=1476197 RepID=UPI000BA5C742|nr:hypothetical protein [Helicobacter sp. 12S02232-10]PAF49435.1 hypothetical protein BKH41_01855 [Helicobacter sp. 12S02232-10]